MRFSHCVAARAALERVEQIHAAGGESRQKAEDNSAQERDREVISEGDGVEAYGRQAQERLRTKSEQRLQSRPAHGGSVVKIRLHVG